MSVALMTFQHHIPEVFAQTNVMNAFLFSWSYFIVLGLCVHAVAYTSCVQGTIEGWAQEWDRIGEWVQESGEDERGGIGGDGGIDGGAEWGWRQGIIAKSGMG